MLQNTINLRCHPYIMKDQFLHLAFKINDITEIILMTFGKGCTRIYLRQGCLNSANRMAGFQQIYIYTMGDNKYRM